MKIKFSILYILVGAAFLAASAWVFLSRGRSAKAVRAKFRLGGMLLTITTMLGAASCHGPGPFVTCYDVVAEVPVEVTVSGANNTVKAGDVITLTLQRDSFSSYSYEIGSLGEVQQVLQKGEVKFDEKGIATIKLEATPFTGKAYLKIFGEEQGEPFEINYVTITYQ